MLEITDLAQLPVEFRGGVVSIGNFDGVHLGHAEIVRRMKAMAGQRSAPSIVFTFDPHPVRLLRPEHAPPPLTWIRRKALLLAEQGVDALIAFPTDRQLLGLEAREFFEQIVVDKLAAQGMVEGTNFNFGRNRLGDIELLNTLCCEHQIELKVVEPLRLFDGIVSSSRIRETLRAGNVELASQLLARPYRVRGMVTHGAQRGREIGFPTANLAGVDTLVPGTGVYAGVANFDNHPYVAAINVGHSPTFGETAERVEVHILDFHENIYGEPLEVDFVARLRDVRKFDDIQALKHQLAIDAEQSRQTVRL